MIDKPIPESYWVLPGYFLAGRYPVSSPVEEIVRAGLAKFLEAGFNSFFDLTRPGERLPYLPELKLEATRYGIAVDYQRFDFQDWGLPAHERMVSLLDAIDSALAAGRKVYLHCWGGIGRTGMAVGCWLVRHGSSGEQALIRLNKLYSTAEQSQHFSRTPETEAQVKFILEWREDGLA